MIAVAGETVGPAMRRGPRDRLLQRLQGRLLRVHAGGARPAHDPPGEHAGDECGIREAPVGHAHVGDAGHVQPVRRLGLEPAVHQVGPAARALRGPGGDGRLPTPGALHAGPAHDVHHLVAARFPGIPALADEPMPHLAVSVHGGEPAGMDVHDVAGRRLVARPHAADGPWPEHAVAARRRGTAVRRFGQDLADRPDPETVPVFVDARGHQRRVGSSPAANVYGQINVYGVTTKSERYKRSYWTRTAAGNGIGGRKAPVPYGS